MVQFIKAKRSSYINKPIGINNVDTGAVQSANIIANTSAQLTTQFFKQAEDEQIKIGKEYGLSLPTRDKDGKLVFTETPTNLSEIAQNAAEPIIRKKYEDQLNVDIFQKLNAIRNKSKTSTEFAESVQTEMGTYIDETTKNGGGRYASAMSDTVAKLSAQHFSAMAQEERKEELRIASLNRLFITNQQIEDSVSLGAKDLDLAPIIGIKGVIKQLEEQSKEIVAHNDENLTINNLNQDTHRKTDYAAKFTPMKSVILALSKDLSPVEMMNIGQYLTFGDKSKLETLTDKEKALVDVLANSPLQSGIRAEIENITIGKNRVDNKIAALQNREDVQENKRRKKLMEDPNFFRNKLNFMSNSQTEIQSILDKIESNNGVVTEDIKKNLQEWENKIFGAMTINGTEVDGKRILIGIKEGENLLRANIVMSVESKIIKSGVFKTAGDLENLKNAIINKNFDGLNDEQKKIAKEVTNITDASISNGEFLRNNIATSLNDNISTANAFEVNQKKQAENTNVMLSAIGQNSTPFSNTPKHQKILTENLGIDANYFMGEFEEGLNAPEGSDARKKADRVNFVLSKGNLPDAFKGFVENAIRDGSNEQIKQAIGLYKRYSQIEDDGVRVNRLAGMFDVETTALLALASDLIPAYEGQQSFFGVQGSNNGQVTPRQILLQMRAVYQRKNSPDFADTFKTNLKNIIGTSSNAVQYVQDTHKISFNEQAELGFMVEMSAALGLGKTQTDQIIQFAKEGIYLDGEGMVVDFYDGGDDATKSKYSFLNVFSAEERSFARSFIQRKLNDLDHKDDRGQSIGSFKLNYKPSMVIDGKVQYSIGTNVGATLPTIDDTPVFLQPIPYGSSKNDVRYVAVVKNKNTGFFAPIRLPDGSILAFDAENLRKGRTGGT